MSYNSFGQLFRFTTWGESHGPALGCVVDGTPPGIAIDEAFLQTWLDKRKPGQSRFVTQRREPDQVEILSGVFEGKTTGTPISLLIRNEDQRSKDYGNMAETFRPGHADYTYLQKYGLRDHRGAGRASARETAVRVAAGAIAKKWLNERHGVVIRGCLTQIGEIEIAFKSWDGVNDNPFFSPDPGVVQPLEDYMDALRKSGDSIGAKLMVVAENVPVGWGEPVYDRLDAEIAYALMSINAVKGVEIGAGFASVTQHGSQHGDEMTPQGFLSNNAGGILGGISTGQDITVSLAIKPTSSIRSPRHSIDKAGQPIVASMALKPASSILIPGRSVNLAGEAVEVRTKGRHDPCVGIRATPIGEAMLALVLMDHALRHRAQNADVVCTTPKLR